MLEEEKISPRNQQFEGKDEDPATPLIESAARLSTRSGKKKNILYQEKRTSTWGEKKNAPSNSVSVGRERKADNRVPTEKLKKQNSQRCYGAGRRNQLARRSRKKVLPVGERE